MPYLTEMSSEQLELFLFAENDGALHRQSEVPIGKNLQRKLAAGTYNHALAVKAWRYWADEAAKRYTREFDAPHPRTSYGIFTVADRNAVATEKAREFEVESKVQTGGLKPTGREGRYQPRSGRWMFT